MTAAEEAKARAIEGAGAGAGAEAEATLREASGAEKELGGEFAPGFLMPLSLLRSFLHESAL